MKKFILILLGCVIILTFAACDKTPTPVPTPTPTPDDPDASWSGAWFDDKVTAANDDFYEDYSAEEKQLYYDLWSENAVVSVKIDIEPAELAKINEAVSDYYNGNSAKADTYRKCNLTITVNGKDYYYEEVGIRMRGNTSRRDFCDGNGRIYAYVHFRFSLTETFDGDEYEGNAWGKECYHDWSNDPDGRKQRKDRTFATMEKFYYKWNKNYDQTYIREVYANRMFRAYGVLAPHITLTQMQIKQNGVYQNFGVGNLYELIDKQFVKRNFDKQHKGGDLYKCTYSVGPADLQSLDDYLFGIETATERYSYDLKTNDDPEDFNEHKYIKKLITVLKQNKNSADFTTNLEAIVDMDYFVRFEAVNYLLGNPDCMRNHANNYYLYFTPDEGKAYVIPYDYDRCLGADMDWNPHESMVNVQPYAQSTDDMDNALHAQTILRSGLPEYRDMYTQALKRVLAEQWFTYDNYDSVFQAYKQNYAILARPSETIINQCGGNIRADRFVFNATESSDIRTSDANLSVSEYMRLKRITAERGLDK